MTEQKRAVSVSEQTLERLRKGLRAIQEEQQTRTIEATYDDLANAAGLSKATVFNAIRALESEGYITVTPASSRKFPNRYTLGADVRFPLNNMRLPVDYKAYIQPSSTVETVQDLRLKEVIDAYEHLKQEHNELLTRLNECLVLNKDDILVTTELPGGLIQYTVKAQK